jgi:hypothetical protein
MGGVVGFDFADFFDVFFSSSISLELFGAFEL